MPATDRMYANTHDGAVVFLIGMRLNRPWKVHKWWPVFIAMPRMLRQLAKRPELGLLGARTYVSLPNVMVVQYWESEAKLTGFSRDPSLLHLPAWKAFNKAIGSGGDVGIWHETYIVPADNIEARYRNMPPHGLAKARGYGDARGFPSEPAAVPQPPSAA
jgi:hypothetical protein